MSTAVVIYTLLSYKATVSTAVTYTSLCKLNSGYHNSHVFSNIFQTKHISTVKFSVSYEKNMSFLLISKSQKLGKNFLKKIRAGFEYYNAK